MMKYELVSIKQLHKSTYLLLQIASKLRGGWDSLLWYVDADEFFGTVPSFCNLPSPSSSLSTHPPPKMSAEDVFDGAIGIGTSL